MILGAGPTELSSQSSSRAASISRVSDRRQLVQIMFKRTIPQCSSAVRSELQRSRPEFVLLRRQRSLLERQDLVQPFDDRNVSEERADRVARRIVDVIEFAVVKPCTAANVVDRA